MAQVEDPENNDDGIDENMIYLQLSTSIGQNDVLYCPYRQIVCDKNKEDTKNEEDNMNNDEIEVDNVIFFGGDVQDLQKYMIQRHTFNDYGDFCLESVLKILRYKFPTSNILVIRPCQRNGHFSIFSNFISNIDNYGESVPSYKNGNGCQHLIELLSDKQLNRKNINNDRLHLIGFSRGVNVLNQLIYETDKRNKNKQFVNKLFDNIYSMYFLDGGNGGKHKTLPNDDGIIDNFVQNVINDGFRFNIYGTNYQWKDQHRAWIGREQSYFVDFIKLLQQKGNKDSKKSYFLHHNLYNDQELNESLLKNNVTPFKTAKNKGIYRHFELLRLFNVNKARFLL